MEQRKAKITFVSLYSVCILVLAFLFAYPDSAVGLVFEETSGITRLNDDLLIVSDNDAGVYYRFPLTGREGPIMTIDPTRVLPVRLPEGRLALDLESIGVLADGRIVVLSERLRALIGEGGIVAEYGGSVGEFGNRGLEGLAVRKLEDGNSRVAVLWEGGYPEYYLVPEQLREKIGRFPLRPVVWIHDLPNGAVVDINERTQEVYAVQRIELEVPWPDAQGPPLAQRFRAPDFVWYMWMREGKEEWGFIVLLNSQNSPPEGTTQYRYQWLQRFTLDGKAFGEPLDLVRMLPPGLQERNWEGLGWFEEGKTLVMIHDIPPRGTPVAYVVRLPEHW